MYSRDTWIDNTNIVIIRIVVSGADIQVLEMAVRRPNFKIGQVQL